MKISCVAFCLVVLVAVIQISNAAVANTVTCTYTELNPCMPALTSSQPPSSFCCSKLREQKPCLCGYVKNPNLSKYVNSPNAKKVASTCGVPYPKCG